MMKRTVALLLCCAMLISVCACGRMNEPKAVDTGSTQEEQRPPIDETASLVALKSDNYTLTNGGLYYFYATSFFTLYSSYGSYFSSMGIDPTKSLREQIYTEGTTWHDYLMDLAMTDAKAFMYYAEAAKAAGVDDSYVEDKVNKEFSNIVLESGIDTDEYIYKMFGNHLSEDDLRQALALQIYALDYYKTVTKEYTDAVTEADLDSYAAEHEDTVNKVSYLTYTISADMTDVTDSEGSEAATSAAKAQADALVAAAASGGADGYKQWVTQHITESNAASDTPMTDEVLAAQIESQTTEVTGAAYSEGDEFLEWAYEEGRSAGETKLVESSVGSYTVYLLTSTPARDETATKNVCHILISASDGDEDTKSKAEEVLLLWQKGEATRESFEALSEDYNDDGNCLYENVTKGYMVDSFDAWIYDEARKPGDSGIVETQYGHHIMYFVGDGLKAWQSEVRQAIVSERLSDNMTRLDEKYSSAVSVDQDNITKIADVISAGALNQGGSGTNVY